MKKTCGKYDPLLGWFLMAASQNERRNYYGNR